MIESGGPVDTVGSDAATSPVMRTGCGISRETLRAAFAPPSGGKGYFRKFFLAHPSRLANPLRDAQLSHLIRSLYARLGR